MSQLIEAVIKDKKSWGDYFFVTFQAPELAALAAPGQFVMVKVSPKGPPLLRRPFSLASADREEGTIAIFFQRVGLGTNLLSRYSPGEKISLIGPLGRGFSFEDLAFPGELLLIGGGRGIAPLYYLAQKLKERGLKVIIFYGGKTQSDLPLREALAKKKLADKLILATEDGSLGFKGLITDVLEQEVLSPLAKKAFVCGPEAMMKKVAELLRRWNLPGEFSLEAFMGCGFGVCWGCVRWIKRGQEYQLVRICQEGPVFSREDVKWSEEE